MSRADEKIGGVRGERQKMKEGNRERGGGEIGGGNENERRGSMKAIGGNEREGKHENF